MNKRIGKTRMKVSAAEKQRRHDRGVHNIEPVEAQDLPLPETLVVAGVQRCAFCSAPHGIDFVVCPMCHNCQYCGLYNVDDHYDSCYNCGNLLPEHKRLDNIKIPSINLDI